MQEIASWPYGRGVWFVAVLILAAQVVSAQGPVSIDEAKIRAVLKDGATVIVVPVECRADQPIGASLSLAWLSHEDQESRAVQRNVTLSPGATDLEIPLPLTNSSIWTRLRYSLTPDRKDAREFGRINGIVAFPQIADYAFELRTSYAGAPQPGRPLVVHAEAVHPVTRAPVRAEWTAALSIGDKEIPPRRIDKHEGGLIDFVFDLPPTSEESVSVDISAERGDFSQDVTNSINIPKRMTAQFQTDKPLYQPGQTLHLRAVVLNAQGRAAAGERFTLRIEDGSNERVHTVDVESSKFGVVHDDWQLPASATLGTYQIALVNKGDREEEIAHHAVRISRYDLPSFTVTVKPDRTSYLATQQTRVTVTGTYLFGKPVLQGQVRIIRLDSEDKAVAEGPAVDGSFTAVLDLQQGHRDLHERDHARFEDVHLTAYYKDPTSGRTEQRRFDVRLTREPIHVYLVRAFGALYVSTSFADGRPAATVVDIFYCGQTTSVRTNRLGVGKSMLAKATNCDGQIELQAKDAAGLTGRWKEYVGELGRDNLRLDTPRTLHRAGDAVTLMVTAPASFPADELVLVHAVAGNVRLASRVTQLKNHQGPRDLPLSAGVCAHRGLCGVERLAVA